MDKETSNSLDAIIAYMWSAEQRHWEESGEPETGHIFNEMTRAAKGLNLTIYP